LICRPKNDEAKSQASRKEKARKLCFANNSFENLRLNVRTETVEEGRHPYLYPNYYVRMLNGMADSCDTLLTRDHLEVAKSVLASFDVVLILEDPSSSLEHIFKFLGDFSKSEAKKVRDRAVSMPKLSSNLLKKMPFYEEIRASIDAMKTLFENENGLDIELYQFAIDLSKKNKFVMRDEGGL